MPKNIALFASGSGTNVQNIIDTFKNNPEINVALVLCNNPNAFVIERAKNESVPCVVFSRDEFYNSSKIIDALKKYNIDFIVLAGFLWLVPNAIIDAYSKSIINIHPALLPKYGGKGMYGMKVHEAVKNANEKQTGITIHYVNNRYDEGNIIFQAICPVLKKDTPEDIAKKIHELEHKHFPTVIANCLQP